VLGVPIDDHEQTCVVCDRRFRTVRYSQLYCGAKCRTYALNARRIDKQRRTGAPPRVSPAMIARRAAVIRAERSEQQVTEVLP